MEETEKMTALKKAYAEIILNTAKEAAARIIVSERRAQSFQRDLSATKDEALRIMLQIKQMIDFKMNEAETKSLIQQKRIDKLEAQLQEAEDIVSNLRAELYDTQAESERLSRNQQRPPDSACHTSDAGKIDVTSTVIRSTKPGLYRNGCTQRIRACDRNHSNGHLSLSTESDDLKNEKLKEADKGGCRIDVLMPASGVETAQNEERNPVSGTALSRLKRKRAMRKKRNKTSVLTLVASEIPNVSQTMACASSLTNHSLKGTSNYSKANQESGLEGRLAFSETENVSVAVTDKDLEVADALVLITQESVSKTDIGVTGSEEKQEVPTLSLEKSNTQVSDLSDVLSIQSPKSRIVKYTFQRKRKKESIVNDEINRSPQKDVPEQTTGKGQNGDLNSLTSESSHDSRRMAQVARQLISMSEKSRWK